MERGDRESKISKREKKLDKGQNLPLHVQLHAEIYQKLSMWTWAGVNILEKLIWQYSRRGCIRVNDFLYHPRDHLNTGPFISLLFRNKEGGIQTTEVSVWSNEQNSTGTSCKMLWNSSSRAAGEQWHMYFIFEQQVLQKPRWITVSANHHSKEEVLLLRLKLKVTDAHTFQCMLYTLRVLGVFFLQLQDWLPFSSVENIKSIRSRLTFAWVVLRNTENIKSALVFLELPLSWHSNAAHIQIDLWSLYCITS